MARGQAGRRAMSSNRTQMTPVSDVSNATLWKEVEYDIHATCIVHSRRALDISTPHSVEACCAPASTPTTATPRTVDSAPAPATRNGCGMCSTSDTWKHSETRRRLRSADQISEYPPSATASNSLVMKDLRRRRATCKLSFTPEQNLKDLPPNPTSDFTTPGTGKSLCIGRCWLPATAARPTFMSPPPGPLFGQLSEQEPVMTRMRSRLWKATRFEWPASLLRPGSSPASGDESTPSPDSGRAARQPPALRPVRRVR